MDRTQYGTDGDGRFQGLSEDGERLLYTGVDNGDPLLYIWVDTCQHADTAEGVRGHVPPRTTIARTACLWQRRPP